MSSKRSIKPSYRSLTHLFHILLFSMVVLAALRFYNPFYHVFPEGQFLTVHTLIEFFCAFVALSTFAVTWYTYPNSRHLHSFFLGIVFLSVGLLDLGHALSYKGMPDFFTINNPDKATTLHVLARLIFSAFILFSAVLLKSKVFVRYRYFLLFLSFAFSTTILALVTFFPQHIPIMHFNDEGLTGAKIMVEIIIIFLFLLGGMAYLSLLNGVQDVLIVNLIYAIAFNAVSEVAFVMYSNVYDIYNFLGHLFKLIAYVGFFRAAFIFSIERPYIELAVAREKLQEANQNLEVKVEERTRELSKANKKLKKAATIDFLTGAYNRSQFQNLLKREINLVDHNKNTLHIIALDIDSFKNINDSFGHSVGDQCLRHLVQIADEVLRPTDIIGRLGGDEFNIILPQTSLEAASKIAENLRIAVSEKSNPTFTISIGIAGYPKDAIDIEKLLIKADQALYKAKQEGKNKVSN